MTLGFMRMFEPMLMDGTKHHSVREGERWQAGMRADCYVDPRQRTMRLLFRVVLNDVRPIIIEHVDRGSCYLHENLLIAIDGDLLSRDERELFAWHDGFRDPDRPDNPASSLKRMVEFWRLQHGFGTRTYHFSGQILYWDPKDRMEIGGSVSVEEVAQAIRIYGYEPRLDQIEKLPPPRRKAVELFCYKSHLRASDNRCKVPPKPAYFDLLLDTGPLPIGPMGNGTGDWSETYAE